MVLQVSEFGGVAMQYFITVQYFSVRLSIMWVLTQYQLCSRYRGCIVMVVWLLYPSGGVLVVQSSYIGVLGLMTGNFQLFFFYSSLYLPHNVMFSFHLRQDVLSSVHI